MVLKELNSALSDMQKIKELDPLSTIDFDRDCLTCLKTATLPPPPDGDPLKYFKESKKNFEFIEKSYDKNKKDGHFFKISDVYFFIGINHFYIRNFEKALQYFNNSLDSKKNLIRQQEKKKQKEKEFLYFIS